MTDIVERLRGKPVRHDYFPEADRQEAAVEIAKWREENERLRAALQEIADMGTLEYAAKAVVTARCALEPKP